MALPRAPLVFDENGMSGYEAGDHQVSKTHKIHALFENIIFKIVMERDEAA
jgi:hypothetical protein